MNGGERVGILERERERKKSLFFPMKKKTDDFFFSRAFLFFFSFLRPSAPRPRGYGQPSFAALESISHCTK